MRAAPIASTDSIVRITIARAALTCLASVGALAACGPESAVDRGAALFRDPGFARASANLFSCATCHDTSVRAPDAPDGDGRRLPGYTLRDVTARPSWWGGSVLRLLDATNECYVGFMRGQALTPDDPDGRALLAWLESNTPSAPGTAPALPLTIVKDIVDVPRGDPVRGRALYDAACAFCHGAKSSGDGRLGARVPVIPDETLAQHGRDPLTGAAPITIEKVRHGKYFGVGGNMPPLSLEAMRDAELGDLLAYLGL